MVCFNIEMVDNKKPQKWGLKLVLVAGAGFEPTTFGL